VILIQMLAYIFTLKKAFLFYYRPMLLYKTLGFIKTLGFNITYLS